MQATLVWLFSIVLLVSLPIFGQEDGTTSEEIERVDRQISIKQSLKETKTKERAALRQQIAEVQNEYATLQRENQSLIQRLDQSEEEIARYEARIKVDAELQNQKAVELVWNAVSSQQLKERNPITMLVVQSDPLKVDRLYHYHQYFASQLETQVVDLEEQLQGHQRMIDELVTAQAEYETITQDYRTNEANLQDRRHQLESLNTQLQSEIEVLDADIAQLLKERQQLRELIEARSAEISAVNPNAEPIRPESVLNWPVSGDVREEFGVLRADGRFRSEGLVIDAELGDPITAIASGTVLFAEWFEGYGNTIIISHADEVISIYARCDVLFKQADEPVESGERIALVGTGGADTTPGLYFEIRVRNEPTDPLRWLQSR